ncbi:MAG: efflux RND transporter periplasmic adaptor subunit [Paracoccaceae bacterium]
MALRIKTHRIVAILVLIAAVVWVATGEFTTVGGDQASAVAQASEAEKSAPADSAASLRTVAAVAPIIEPHAIEIRLSGVTAPEKTALLAARSNGVIAQMNIIKGAPIRAGDVVMTLEGADVIAGAKVAEVALDQRQRELEVAQKLFAKGNTSELSLIGARSAEAAAEAQLSQAKAAVDRLILRAPFNGVVDSVDVEVGEWVQVGTPITTILALDPIVVKTEISEMDVRNIATGAQAHVRLVKGIEMDGRVRFISETASAETRTFAVEVALPNPTRDIPAGMTAEVTLFTDPVPAVMVPRSIITLSDDGKIGLRVVGADNVARFAPVELIDDTPDGLVLTGVPEDVRIIVSGQDLVRDGEKVNVVVPPATNTGTSTAAVE